MVLPQEVTLTSGALVQSEAGNHDDWDDSLLTKEQMESRLQRKVEAVIKRERAMAYAYSHQVLYSNLAELQLHPKGWPPIDYSHTFIIAIGYLLA